MHIGNFVFLEQEADTTGVLTDDVVLALEHLCHVHLHPFDADAMCGKVVGGGVEVFRRLQQGFGRDATHV